jgi:two-component system chemotaxis response regulator CheB
MAENYKIVVIGGSAGSFSVVRTMLESLPENFPIPIVMCLHRLKEYRNGFVESLNFASSLPVCEPLDKDPIKAGRVYLSPANYHLLIENTRTFALSTEEEVNFSRPALDITFQSAAKCYGDKMIGILLSGANRDGAEGLEYSKRRNAYTIVQDPCDAQFETMPGEAIKHFNPDRIMKKDEIIEFLKLIAEMNSRKRISRSSQID